MSNEKAPTITIPEKEKRKKVTNKESATQQLLQIGKAGKKRKPHARITSSLELYKSCKEIL